MSFASGRYAFLYDIQGGKISGSQLREPHKSRSLRGFESEERAKIELRAGKSLPDMRSPIFVEREAVVWSAKI